MSDDAPNGKLHSGRLQPGQTANPGGRPKGLERRVREQLGNAIDAIIYVHRCVAMGVPPERKDIEALGVELTPRQWDSLLETFSAISRRDAVESAKLVIDRGWGKAKQHVDLGGTRGRPVPAKMLTMTDEQLRALAALDDGIGDEDEIIESGSGRPTEH